MNRRRVNRLIHIVLAYMAASAAMLAYGELDALAYTPWAPWATLAFLGSLLLTVRFSKEADRLK